MVGNGKKTQTTATKHLRMISLAQEPFSLENQAASTSTASPLTSPTIFESFFFAEIMLVHQHNVFRLLLAAVFSPGFHLAGSWIRPIIITIHQTVSNKKAPVSPPLKVHRKKNSLKDYFGKNLAI